MAKRWTHPKLRLRSLDELGASLRASLGREPEERVPRIHLGWARPLVRYLPRLEEHEMVNALCVGADVSIGTLDGRVLVGTVVHIDRAQLVLRLFGVDRLRRIAVAKIERVDTLRAHRHRDRQHVAERQRRGEWLTLRDFKKSARADDPEQETDTP